MPICDNSIDTGWRSFAAFHCFHPLETELAARHKARCTKSFGRGILKVWRLAVNMD